MYIMCLVKFSGVIGELLSFPRLLETRSSLKQYSLLILHRMLLKRETTTTKKETKKLGKI